MSNLVIVKDIRASSSIERGAIVLYSGAFEYGSDGRIGDVFFVRDLGRRQSPTEHAIYCKARRLGVLAIANMIRA
jgi:hypothetical protein